MKSLALHDGVVVEGTEQAVEPEGYVRCLVAEAVSSSFCSQGSEQCRCYLIAVLTCEVQARVAPLIAGPLADCDEWSASKIPLSLHGLDAMRKM